MDKGNTLWSIEPGEWIQHKHSLAYYQYHGRTERNNLCVISDKEGINSFTISDETLYRNYARVHSPYRALLIEGRKYRRNGDLSGLYLKVENIYYNPVDAKRTAFVWMYYPSGHVYANMIPESIFVNYEEVE